MKRIGMHPKEGWTFSDLASFKRDSSVGGRHARRDCKKIARAEKRSENFRVRMALIEESISIFKLGD